MVNIIISNGRGQGTCYCEWPCFHYLHVLRAIDAFTNTKRNQVSCQKLLSFILCSDLLSTCRGCLKKLRTICCSYRWTNYFYVFISRGEYQRRFVFCATSDKWDPIRQCERASKFHLFFFVSKIMSCWFSFSSSVKLCHVDSRFLRQ